MTTAIIILNWNGVADTLACLSALAHVKGEIIVVDNGSTDSSCKAIHEQCPQVTLIKNEKNLGYAGGNNVGIEYALSKGHAFILLLNNDTLPNSDLVTVFEAYAHAHPEIGIFGAYPSRFSDPSKLDHLGGVWNPKKAVFDLVGLGEPSDFVYEGVLDYVCGCSIFIRREIFETIGLLEPRYFLFWEEADFCMRAKKAGFQIGICQKARLLHKVSASFQGGKPHTTYFWWRSRLLWISRNLSFKAKCKTYFFLLSREFWKLHKHFVLKTLQFKISSSLEKERKIYQDRAALTGIYDYFKGSFGSGPSWIYRKL